MKTSLPLTPAAVLVPAGLLGVAGDLLFRNAPIGLNLALWTTGAALGWMWLRFRAGEVLTRDERILLAAIATLTVALLWRENESLRLLNLGGLAACAVLLPLAAAGGPVSLVNRLSSSELIQAILRFGIRVAAGLMPGLVEANREKRQSPGGIPVAALIRGGLLTAPLLGVFGALLVNADADFGAFLGNLFHFDPEPLVQHAVLLLVFSWLGAALIGGAIHFRHAAFTLPSTAGLKLGGVEVGMILGGTNLLFSAYVGFQVPHFFGGAGQVAAEQGLTYATYARGGFFELVAVAALTLPMLLVVEALSRDTAPRTVRLYRGLALWQVAVVLAIMASAIHRMSLYQQQFGMTEDRFFASAFIAGLAVTFGWFVATMLRGLSDRFLGGTLVAWAAWLVLLNVANPERIIVETNFARGDRGAVIDLPYLAKLSADAVPAILANPRQRNSYLIDQLSQRKDLNLAQSDWRGWHAGRARARALLQRAIHPAF